MITRILIIDDDDDDRELFKLSLHTVDPAIEYKEAADGVDALHLLATKVIFPDVIFLDLNMPRLNGIEFLKIIKSIDHLKDIPVVIYSTSKRKKDQDETKKLGAVHFITKPYRLADLQRELADFLALKSINTPIR